MTDYNNLRLEKSVENTQKLVEKSDKGLKVFRSAVFEAVAAVLLVALFLYENGTLTVKEQDIIVFLGNIAVMFILSMLFDNNYRIKGKLVGFSTAKYLLAYKELAEIKKSLTDAHLKKLDEKIEEYVEKELEKRRRSMLYKNGVTVAEYEKIRLLSKKELKSQGVSCQKALAVRHASRLKKEKLSTATLLSETEDEDFVKIGKSGGELDKIHNVKNAVTYILSAGVFAYFAVGLSKDFTLAAFGWYMMKVCFLVFRGMKSYFESYMEITEKRVGTLENKRLLLSYFLGDNA